MLACRFGHQRPEPVGLRERRASRLSRPMGTRFKARRMWRRGGTAPARTGWPVRARTATLPRPTSECRPRLCCSPECCRMPDRSLGGARTHHAADLSTRSPMTRHSKENMMRQAAAPTMPHAPLSTMAHRRQFIVATVMTCLTVASCPQAALAQSTYPSKPIRVVVPFGPGSSPDVVARLWSEKIAKATGQAVVIENKPGGATIIGSQAVATAAPDGYTLLYAVNSFSINPFIFKSVPYRSSDFVPVVRVLSVPYVIVVAPNSRIETLGDLIAAARKEPGKLNYASYGVGNGTHVAMAWLLNATGTSMTHVAYKDSPSVGVMSGDVTSLMEPSTTAIPMVQSKKLRALAVTGPKRLDALPQTPTVAETLPGFQGDSWHGLLAPKGTPPEVVQRLAALSAVIIASDDFRRRLLELGLVPAGGTPAEFGEFLAQDSRNWEKVVRDNRITAD
ncbi:tripartite tricarboxylate transporter substrate binding protein [Variovorax defluvii]|uniref:Bug family tripartite tricarboxylate transporter substrate binding protein n=1 Tax=Variovorax defluvii TaxID=913761 RepID=UPI0031E87F23